MKRLIAALGSVVASAFLATPFATASETGSNIYDSCGRFIEVESDGTINDGSVESGETLTAPLSSQSSGAGITTAVGTGTINNND